MRIPLLLPCWGACPLHHWERQCARTLTARPARPDVGCGMANSQIEMVVQDDGHPGGWLVCGDLKEAPDGQVDVYLVVRQGDVVARGSDLVSAKEWQFPVTPPGKPAGRRAGQVSDRLSGAGREPGDPRHGDAISSSQAVGESTGPEASAGQLSWTHELKVH